MLNFCDKWAKNAINTDMLLTNGGQMLYNVSGRIPPTDIWSIEMRELDRIAREQFDGDTHKAIESLLYNLGEEAFEQYAEELTKEESAYTLTVIKEHEIRRLGGKKNYKKAEKLESLLEYLEMSYAEVAATEKNPYTGKIVLACIGMLAAMVVGPTLLLMEFEKLVYGYASAFALCVAFSAMADEVLGWFRFRKARHLVEWTKQLDFPEYNKRLEEPVEN